MSDISIEEKLQLVRQVRSQHYQNRSDMLNREQILYGRTSPVPLDSSYNLPKEMEPYAKTGTFKIRVFIAVILITILILMDINNDKFLEISVEDITKYIQIDSIERVIELVK